MALFRKFSSTTVQLFTPVKPYGHDLPRGDKTVSYVSSFPENKDHGKESFSDFGDENENTLLEHSSADAQKTLGSKRRIRTTIKSRKRRRRSEEDFCGSENEDEDALDGVTLIESTSPEVRAQRDRKVMPPPKTLGDRDWTPNRQMVDKNLIHDIVRRNQSDPSSDDDEEEIYTDKNRVRKDDRREIASDYYFERAKRYAEATELPTNSGIWSLQEEDLFHRLAMRGFEPLIPGNWLIDFTTFPQSIFDVEDGDPALIQSKVTRQFRAIFQLRSLVMMGMRARDRSLVKLPCEPIMRSIIKSYISWALEDAGLHPSQRPHTIPIHVIATKRKKERATNVTARITRKLSRLADQHQAFHNIHPSVEQDDTSKGATHDHNTTTVSEDDDPRLPILTGIMICATIVVIFTFDSHRSSMVSCRGSHSISSTHLPPSTSPSKSKQLSLMANQEQSGLRIIGSFDFSELGMDVWNALAVAIVVMRIRKKMEEMCEIMTGEGASEEERRMWRTEERRSEDREDD